MRKIFILSLMVVLVLSKSGDRNLRGEQRPPRLEDELIKLIPINRTFDGSGNNEANPQFGQINTELKRKGQARYPDGLGQPAPGPNPRRISNVIGRQSQNIQTSRQNLTMLFTIFGQFLDHDLSITFHADPTEPDNIVIPQGDPYFTPGDEIQFARATHNDGTSAPRQHINSITPFLDSGNVYGSSSQFAQTLRSGIDGKMKVSEGDLLPLVDDNFVAGDVRANQNVLLTSLHTIFMRLHNQICDRMVNFDNSLNDQQLYTIAKNLVTGHWQHIVFDEWLPHVVGEELTPYSGYKSDVDPQLDNQFTTAAFRFGHSLLIGDIPLVNQDGTQQQKTLQELFGNPGLFQSQNQLLNRAIRGISRTATKQKSVQVIDQIRNLLILTGDRSVTTDLFSLNIQRGRDHGLPTYNDMRQVYGLPRLQSFNEITRSDNLRMRLTDLYTNIDQVELWIGLLAEGGDRGSVMGNLGAKMIADNFHRVRDGDRFWYESAYPQEVVSHIKNTSFADIIRQVSGVNDVSNNPFVLPQDPNTQPPPSQPRPPRN